MEYSVKYTIINFLYKCVKYGAVPAVEVRESPPPPSLVLGSGGRRYDDRLFPGGGLDTPELAQFEPELGAGRLFLVAVHLADVARFVLLQHLQEFCLLRLTDDVYTPVRAVLSSSQHRGGRLRVGVFPAHQL